VFLAEATVRRSGLFAIFVFAACLFGFFSCQQRDVPLPSKVIHKRAINSLIWVPDLTSVFSASDDSIVKQLSSIDLKEINELETNGEAILCAKYWASKTSLILGSTSGDVFLVYLSEQMRIGKQHISQDSITAVESSTNWVSIGTVTGQVVLLNNALKEVTRLSIHNGKVRCLRIHPGETTLYSLGDDGVIVLYDLVEKHVANTYKVLGDVLEVSSDGTTLIVSGTTNRVFSIRGNELTKTDEKPGHMATTTGLCFSNHERYLATCSSEGTLIVWEFPFKKRIISIQTLPRTQLCSVCFVSDNKLLCGSIDGKIFWIDVP
jgi:WD40 repeat protein